MMRPAETAVYQTRSTTSAHVAGMFEKVGVRHSSVRPKAPARLPLAMTSVFVWSYSSQLAVAPASFEDQENVSLRGDAGRPRGRAGAGARGGGGGGWGLGGGGPRGAPRGAGGGWARPPPPPKST